MCGSCLWSPTRMILRRARAIGIIRSSGFARAASSTMTVSNRPSCSALASTTARDTACWQVEASDMV